MPPKAARRSLIRPTPLKPTSTTVTDELKRKVKLPITEDKKNPSCDERKLPGSNNMSANLPPVTLSRIPDQHSITGSNTSNGSINGTLTSRVNSTSTNNVNISDSNNLSVHLNEVVTVPGNTCCLL